LFALIEGLDKILTLTGAMEEMPHTNTKERMSINAEKNCHTTKCEVYFISKLNHLSFEYFIGLLLGKKKQWLLFVLSKLKTKLSFLLKVDARLWTKHKQLNIRKIF